MVSIKQRTIFELILIMFLGICICTFSSFLMMILDENNSFYKENIEISSTSPININGNDELSSSSSKGEGTLNNPYIIEDLNIDGGGSNFCINISNTNEYFIIQNCTLKNQDSKRVIIFNNVSFGAIFDNKISQGPVFILNSKYVNISENRLFNGSGLWLFNMNFSYLISNNLNNSVEVRFTNSHNNSISNNYIRYNSNEGLILDNSENNVVKSNEIYDCGEHGLCIWSNSTNNLVEDNYIYNNKQPEIDYHSGLEELNNVSNNYFEYKEEDSKGGDGIPFDLTPLIIFIVIIAIAVVIIIATPIMIRRYKRKKKEKYMLPED